MGYAKYYEDIILAQSDREYMLSTQHIKGRINGIKIDDANLIDNKKEKQSTYDSIKLSLAEVEYSISIIDTFLQGLRSVTLIEKLKEFMMNLDIRRTNLYEYLYDNIFRNYKCSIQELVVSEQYIKKFKQFLTDIVANLMKNLLPEDSIELRRFEDDLITLTEHMNIEYITNVFEAVIENSSMDFTITKCFNCKQKTYNEIAFCINCLKEIDNE